MIFIIIIFMKSTSTVKSANYYGLALNAIFLKQSSAKEFYSALLIKLPAKKKKTFARLFRNYNQNIKSSNRNIKC